MKKTAFIDNDGIELSIHESIANGFVIHLTDSSIDEPYDIIAYRLELEDIDEIIKQLKVVKKQIAAR